MEKLKPCPFCGADENWVRYRPDLPSQEPEGWGTVTCVRCDTDGPYRGTKENAEIAWNKRVEVSDAGAGKQE
jgi:Lar family restriction alleviation protein